MSEASSDRQQSASSSDRTGQRTPHATKMVELAADIELFHSPNREAFATLSFGNHHETWALRSERFRDFLRQLYYETSGTVPRSQAVLEAVDVLAGRALFSGMERTVYVRMAGQDGTLHLDLANTGWDVVEISAAGWKIISDPPVKFRRPRGMQPLPTPSTGGDLSLLERFVNIEQREDMVLYQAWLLGALRHAGKFPVLVLQGEHGSAKSTTARVARSLIDPSTVTLRSQPRDERDLVIAASNSWCVALDNLSSLRPWLSDGLCRLATGGGFGTRQLYTDAEEILIDVERPIIINGISELATSGDLLDRSIVLTLPAIADHRRRTEADFWADFQTARPYILGALLDAVVVALRNQTSAELDKLPRMADFARWIIASEPVMPWGAGDFMLAYMGNRDEGNITALEASPIVQPLRELAAAGDWDGTATELLAELERRALETTKRLRSWPKTGRTLTNTLRRLVPNLRATGLEVMFDRESSRRVIRLSSPRNSSSLASSASSKAEVESKSFESVPPLHDADDDDDARLQPLAAAPDSEWEPI